MSTKQQERGGGEPTEEELRAEAYKHLHAAQEALANDEWNAFEDALLGARSYGRRLAPGWKR